MPMQNYEMPDLKKPQPASEKSNDGLGEAPWLDKNAQHASGYDSLTRLMELGGCEVSALNDW